MTQVTTDQDQILNQVNAAIAADDMETAIRVGKQLQVPPELAKCFKKAFGTEYLKNSGFNLSAAEELYGKNWLDR